MGNAIIAGIFTLAGVLVGVLLEPVKAAVARRALLRQERAERCAELIDAVTVASTWLITLNRQFRDELSGREPSLPAATYEIVRAEFIAARQTIRKTVWLLRLSGPDDLAAAAQRIREVEREVRSLRQTPDDDQSEGRDAVPRSLSAARDMLDAELARFVDVARRCTK